MAAPRRLLASAVGLVYVSIMGVAIIRRSLLSDSGTIHVSSKSPKFAHNESTSAGWQDDETDIGGDQTLVEKNKHLIETGNFDWVPVQQDEQLAWEERRNGPPRTEGSPSSPPMILPMHCGLGQCRQARWSLFPHDDGPSPEGARATNDTLDPSSDLMSAAASAAAATMLAAGGNDSTVGGDDVAGNVDVFVRPSMSSSLANLSHVLRAIHDTNQRRRSVDHRHDDDDDVDDSICTLWFVGDSLSSDTAMAALCQLVSTMDYRITHCDSRNIGAYPAQYGTDLGFCETSRLRDPSIEERFRSASKKCSNAEDVTAYYDLELPISNNANNNLSRKLDKGDGNICPRVRIKSSMPFSRANKVVKNNPDLLCPLQPLDEEHGIMVINWGVHCNDPKSTSCMDMFMHRVLEPTLEVLSSTKEDGYSDESNSTITTASSQQEEDRPFTVLWREHEPQHFSDPGGLYILGGKCGPVDKFNNFRNEQAEQYLREHNLMGKGKVKGIVRIYEALKPIWRLHYSDGKDCTHYCFSPWRFGITWHGIYSAMVAPH